MSQKFIKLLFSLLFDSPLPGTMMARSKENYDKQKKCDHIF